MDTKSKNRHKLGIVLILGVILLATVIVLGNYNTFYKNAKKEQDSLTQNYRTSESFMKTFIRDCYVLYSKESGNEYNVKFLDDYYPEFSDKITHLCYSLCNCHCFVDGNKRIALTLSLEFLNLNGYMYCCKDFIRNMENIVLNLAQAKISKELLKEIFVAIIEDDFDNESLQLKIFKEIYGK